MSSDDGVSAANHEKGGDGMESDLDGLTCSNLCYHPYPMCSTGDAMRRP
jgi:hypothetical protein